MLGVVCAAPPTLDSAPRVAPVASGILLLQWWAGYILLFSVALECTLLRSVRIYVVIATILISCVC